MKILSNDIISTRLGDRFYSSYIEVLLNPRRSLILSSNIKLNIGPCGEISMILPGIEKFGVIVNG